MGRVIRPDSEIPVPRAPAQRMANVERLLQYSSTWLFNTNPRPGTGYTFMLGDVGLVVEALSSSPSFFIVPPSTQQGSTLPTPFPVGSILRVYCEGAGGVTVVPGPGVTIHGTTTIPQYASTAWRQRALNEWVPDFAAGVGPAGPPGPPGSGALTVEDDEGNSISSVTLIEYPGTLVSSPGAGHAKIGTGILDSGVTASDAESHGHIYTGASYSHADSVGIVKGGATADSHADSDGYIGANSGSCDASSAGTVYDGTDFSHNGVNSHADSNGFIGSANPIAISVTQSHANSHAQIADGASRCIAGSFASIGKYADQCSAFNEGIIYDGIGSGFTGHAANCHVDSAGNIGNGTIGIVIQASHADSLGTIQNGGGGQNRVHADSNGYIDTGGYKSHSNSNSQIGTSCTDGFASSEGIMGSHALGCDVHSGATVYDAPSSFVNAVNSHADSLGTIGSATLAVGIQSSHADSNGVVDDGSIGCNANSYGYTGTHTSACCSTSNSTIGPYAADSSAHGGGIVNSNSGSNSVVNCSADSGATINEGSRLTHADSDAIMGNFNLGSHADSEGKTGNGISGTPIEGANASCGGTANTNYSSATGRRAATHQKGEITEGTCNLNCTWGEDAQFILTNASNETIGGTANGDAVVLDLDGNGTSIDLSQFSAAQFIIQVVGYDESTGTSACGFCLRGAVLGTGTPHIVGATTTESWIDAALAGSTAVLTITGTHLTITCTSPHLVDVRWTASVHLTRV